MNKNMNKNMNENMNMNKNKDKNKHMNMHKHMNMDGIIVKNKPVIVIICVTLFLGIVSISCSGNNTQTPDALTVSNIDITNVEAHDSNTDNDTDSNTNITNVSNADMTADADANAGDAVNADIAAADTDTDANTDADTDADTDASTGANVGASIESGKISTDRNADGSTVIGMDASAGISSRADGNTLYNNASLVTERDPDGEISEEGKQTLINTAKEFLSNIVVGNYNECEELFDANLRTEMPADKLSRDWNSIAMKAGHFESIAREDYVFRDGMDIVLLVSNHTLRGVVSAVVFSPDKRISGLQFVDTDKADISVGSGEGISTQALAILPDTVIEEDVIIGNGSGYPLNGKLTLPANSGSGVPLPAVVLVHGLEPPQDMDATTGVNKPFRDIAWALAQKGIAVLRYDKRAYSYGRTMDDMYGTSLTVKEDIIDDVMNAKKLLASDNRINSEAILIAGHYLGGMLAPRILDEGDFAGAIILAGSPRSLIDTIMYKIEREMSNWDEGDEDFFIQQLINESQYEAYLSLETASDEEAKDILVFGLNGYYLKEMERRQTADYFNKISAPILILHGMKDAQVSYEDDFMEYRRLADGHSNITLKAYEGLNHIFIKTDMDKSDKSDKSDISEYMIYGTVNIDVTDDIASWIKNNF